MAKGARRWRKYGKPDWVTHCFTAGGTVLNALGSARSRICKRSRWLQDGDE